MVSGVIKLKHPKAPGDTNMEVLLGVSAPHYKVLLPTNKKCCERDPAARKMKDSCSYLSLASLSMQ